MCRILYLIAISIFLPFLGPAQTRIVVIGSSTASGTGASPIDSSWVNLVKAYYKSRCGQGLDTIINLAIGGYTTFNGLPGSSDTGHNITKAMSFHPDIVLISFPTNDAVADIPLSTYLANLRTMYNIVVSAGTRCYIASTQPRNLSNHAQQLTLQKGRDSILAEFPGHSFNFFDPLVAPNSLDINPLYTPDGIHPNNAGHRLLFQVVIDANILTCPPAAPMTQHLAIQHFYMGDGHSSVAAEISLPKDEVILLTLLSVTGRLIRQQSYTCRAPSAMLTAALPPLAAGIYFLKLSTADGDQVVKSFAVRP